MPLSRALPVLESELPVGFCFLLPPSLPSAIAAQESHVSGTRTSSRIFHVAGIPFPLFCWYSRNSCDPAQKMQVGPSAVATEALSSMRRFRFLLRFALLRFRSDGVLFLDLHLRFLIFSCYFHKFLFIFRTNRLFGSLFRLQNSPLGLPMTKLQLLQLLQELYLLLP